MQSKKKQTSGSQLTQPQSRKRFTRRNSYHILHCRSGSLNKLATLSQELTSLQQHIQPQNQLSHRKRRQTAHISTSQLNRQLASFEDIPLKRVTESMKLEPQAKINGYSIKKYEHLKTEFQLRGQQLQLLESQCQKMKQMGIQQREKRKILEQQLRFNQQQIKRLQKKAQKSRIERQQLQKNIEIMSKHIQKLEKATFSLATSTLQSYREQVLEIQLKRINQILQKSRQTRENELLIQLDRLRQQKYNQEQLVSRANVANTMLMKKLQQNEQELESLQVRGHQAVVTSAQYCQLKQKYRQALLELREMRERSGSEQSALLQITLLTTTDYEGELE